MTDDELHELLDEVIGDYLDLLDDPGEVDAGDLADNVMRQLRKAGLQ